MKTSAIEVHDMLSVFSVDEVEKRIGEVPGVASVTVNFAAGNATVRYDETQLEASDIKHAVRQRGFEPGEAAAGSAGPGSDGQPPKETAPAPITPAAPPASPVAASADSPAAPDKAAAPATPASSSAEPDAEPSASASDGKPDKTTSEKS